MRLNIFQNVALLSVVVVVFRVRCSVDVLIIAPVYVVVNTFFKFFQKNNVRKLSLFSHIPYSSCIIFALFSHFVLNILTSF